MIGSDSPQTAGILTMIAKICMLVVLLHCPVLVLAGTEEFILFNGGITIEEREAVPTTGTRLVFFVAGGSFLADIQVSVSDSAGRETLNVLAEGPWLILTLPNGRYRVVATRGNGSTQGGYIEVDGSAKEYGYMFPGQ